MKAILITNFCPHYRVGLFERLGRLFDMEFLFFSEGKEWYWEQRNGTATGDFRTITPQSRVRSVLGNVPEIFLRIISGRYDVVVKCINGKIALPAAYIAARVRRIPFILWTGNWMHPGSLLHRVTYPITRWLYRNADAIVVYGDHVRRYLMKEGVDPQRIFIAYNSVDNDRFSTDIPTARIDELKRSWGSGENRIVLFVGRMEEEKGIEHLLQAMALMPHDVPRTIVLIGSGSARDRLQRQASGIDGLHAVFIDHVDNAVLPSFFAAADVLVLPSVTTRMFKEPWGLVINEAMNQGCPVVATDAVGAAVGGLMEQGVTGIVVREGDAHALADAIHAILTMPDRADTMRRHAREKIRTWNHTQQAHGFEEAIRFVLHHKETHEKQ